MEILQHLHPWAVTAMWTAAALVVATVACRPTFAAAHRFARSRPIPELLVKRSEEPLRLLVYVLAVQAVLQAAPPQLIWMGAVRHLTLVLTIGAATWLGVRLVSTIGKGIILSHPTDVTNNLYARRIQTQTRVLTSTAVTFLILFGVAAALVTFPSVRLIGTGLLASAGLAGLVVGFAAKPLLGNVLAGLQIALTQPIRLDDVVVIKGEFGRIEEITGTYVAIRLWDESAADRPAAVVHRKSVRELDANLFRCAWHGIPVGGLLHAAGTFARRTDADLREQPGVGPECVQPAGDRSQ